MQVPATVAYIHNFVKVKSSAGRLSYDMLDEILDLVYTEKVREEQGGTYGVGTYVGVEKHPTNYAEMVIQFSTDASKVDAGRTRFTKIPQTYGVLRYFQR